MPEHVDSDASRLGRSLETLGYRVGQLGPMFSDVCAIWLVAHTCCLARARSGF